MLHVITLLLMCYSLTSCDDESMSVENNNIEPEISTLASACQLDILDVRTEASSLILDLKSNIDFDGDTEATFTITADFLDAAGDGVAVSTGVYNEGMYSDATSGANEDNFIPISNFKDGSDDVVNAGDVLTELPIALGSTIPTTAKNAIRSVRIGIRVANADGSLQCEVENLIFAVNFEGS